MKKIFWLLLALSLASLSRATIINETGTLRSFILGQCDSCAYDNWTSHIAEGVARPGYNDYGPSWFDPQSTSFGNFTLIPTGTAGDTTLARWRRVFDAAIEGRWNTVDTLFMTNAASWRYELVRFADTELQKTFYIMREQLNLTYRDTNVVADPTDDVIGSFSNGWGLFVFNANPSMSKILIQMPHPDDDYLSIPIGLEMFIRYDARSLMIAGAGREVRWETTSPPFTNEKSTSDPSRNARTPFAVCHEEHVTLMDAGRTSRFAAIQVHSYDYAAHGDLSDIQVTAFRDDMEPNPPLRDMADHKDLIHFLGRFPVSSLDGDNTMTRRVDQYISMWCWPPYAYQMERDSVVIPVIADLTGSPTNQQAIYSHRTHLAGIDPENFIHMEVDEYPDGLWQPIDWHQWLSGSMPATWESFRLPLDYYMPYVVALDSALMYSHIYPDTTTPVMAIPTEIAHLGGNEVWIRWAPQGTDRFFNTYQIFYDTAAITWNSPNFNRTSPFLSDLQYYWTHETMLRGFSLPVERYHFALGVTDIWGHRVLSPTVEFTNTPIQDLTTYAVSPDSLELRWTRQAGDSLYLIYSNSADTLGFNFHMQSDTNVVRVAFTESENKFFQVWKILKR